MTWIIAALYRFAPVADPVGLRAPLARLCCAAGIRGTLLLAPEGINGTIAGSRGGIDRVLAHLRALPGFDALEVRESSAAAPPFRKLKVKVRAEIVTLGEPHADPRVAVGTYVDPADWNALIAAPDVTVIDTRNAYEVAIGSFEGAVDPGTDSFRDFPAWWRDNSGRFAGKRIAMFCTGGIRCEKATSFLIGEGVRDVLHLKGGILGYLAEIPEAGSRWRGACFVFDERVSVGHGLAPGPHVLCHACRRPLAPEDLERPEYVRGQSCHNCREDCTDADRARFAERQRQIDLARARGTAHLAEDAPPR